MKKRKANQETLGEVIDRMLNVYKLRNGLNEHEIINNWEKIVGPVIASRTDQVKIRGKVLYIKVASAAMRHELHFQKSGIKDNVNEFIGADFITEVEIR